MYMLVCCYTLPGKKAPALVLRRVRLGVKTLLGFSCRITVFCCLMGIRSHLSVDFDVVKRTGILHMAISVHAPSVFSFQTAWPHIGVIVPHCQTLVCVQSVTLFFILISVVEPWIPNSCKYA